MAQDTVRISKFLSLVLRHDPGSIALTLDPHGWAEIDTLIERASAHGVALNRDLLAHVVATSDKQRFALDPTGTRIRANQGHSITVDLGLDSIEPPPFLFHGTADRLEGLKSGVRQHVHLSPDEATATKVGRRHGKPVVLRVQSGRMWTQGAGFFRSANGVWLTRAVPPEFLEFPKSKPEERRPCVPPS